MHAPNDDSTSLGNSSRNARRSSVLMPHPQTMDNVLDTHSPAMRQVARELLDGPSLRSRHSIVDVRPSKSYIDDHYSTNASQHKQEDEHSYMLDNESHATAYGATRDSLEDQPPEEANLLSDQDDSAAKVTAISTWEQLLNQVTAVSVICLLNIMIAIPFGASYFPVGWRANGEEDSGGEEEDGDDVHGMFPLQGKQALGIRMFLFATLMGQLAFTFASKFTNPVGLQMVENVPFLHALCHTAIQQQGYGKEALSTVFFLFGLSSVVVGLTFYLLGKWNLGRIVYFFPNHVLVGCIGGIGVFLVVTAMEVTNDVTFTYDMDGLASLIENLHLLAVVLAFEGTLRVLMYLTQDELGHAKYPYLSPVYYCLITPCFYLGLRLFGVSMEQATDMGYFFPATAGGDADSSAWQDDSLWDIFQIIDLSTVSWMAVFHSTGTVVALAAFSLIHVPINIPAFAISTDVEVDMNAELMAHGYANFLSGMFGGLQNYITYSNSVLYAKSGGNGKISSLAIVALTILLFVIGPEIASYLPRCMAGTLLLHIGIDLFLEGVYDSYGNYDQIEYAGIWIIALVMTIWGMTAALIAGVIAALSTYAVQSINHQNPIRQILAATTLQSSDWNRCAAARNILEDEETGRSRILIFQLQGHIFFGNIAQLTDTIKDILKEKADMNIVPIAVIVDFTLVVGMDSSAAHAVAKVKKIIHRLFGVEVSIFVTGSDRDGFPCEFDLSEAISPKAAEQVDDAGIDWNDMFEDEIDENELSLRVKRGSVSVSPGTAAGEASKLLTRRTGAQVCESLDEALRFAEDILIARRNPTLVNTNGASFVNLSDLGMIDMTLDEERYHAKKYLKELFSASDVTDEEILSRNVDILLSLMKRKEYEENQTLWEQGDESDSAQLLVFGELTSVIEDTGTLEPVRWGNLVGELGLVHGTKRLTTLLCSTEKAVLYSLDKETWQVVKDDYPLLARMIDSIVIKYLVHRVQHVSNRYFHTTLPV